MSPADTSISAITEALERYDRPGPRYTSYPTAVEFSDAFGEANYREALRAANAKGEAPLSVYTHLPFCEERCFYCGCHVIISPRKGIADPYLEHLIQEIEMVAAELPDRRNVAQFHLGGGTPTYFSTAQLEALVDAFQQHFNCLPGAELAIEVDPRVTTFEHIDLLATKGFNRISMGVQDFTPEVQEAVNRVQTPEQTEGLASYARERGLANLNIDLIYGLPHQRQETFATTLDRVIAMRPNRVAVYSFAYVPWTKGTQKQISEEDLPERSEKFALYALARTKFMDAGYQDIGMDHFALPDDELAVAQREGRLYRNFMGYTVMPGEDALGFGVSAIGDVQGRFIQNEKKLSTYYAALDDGRLPVHKGFERSADDEVRRDLIQSLMCNFHVKRRELEAKHAIDFDSYFGADLEHLSAYVEEGLAEVNSEEVRATETGKLFVRNLAMCFDAYLARHEESGKPVFSRTV
jgi:oxygen-independent coproporphyrinogen-3 oxidase